MHVYTHYALYTYKCVCIHTHDEKVSADCLCYRALLRKRPIIQSILLTKATPIYDAPISYVCVHTHKYAYTHICHESAMLCTRKSPIVDGSFWWKETCNLRHSMGLRQIHLCTYKHMVHVSHIWCAHISYICMYTNKYAYTHIRHESAILWQLVCSLQL